MVTANLIGESSGGMTSIEIWDWEKFPKLVWSCRWFDNGATEAGYLSGLQTVVNCMKNADAWKEWEEGDREEDGTPVCYDTEEEESTTGVLCIYDTHTKQWEINKNWRNYGQSGEIVEALMLAGLVEADDEFEADDMVSSVSLKLKV